LTVVANADAVSDDHAKRATRAVRAPRLRDFVRSIELSPLAVAPALVFTTDRLIPQLDRPA